MKTLGVCLLLLLALGARAAPPVNLAHLEFLRERRGRPGGRFGLAPISLVWVYCERDPVTGVYTRVHAHGAANRGPELEGVACVDDVARAILVWARELRRRERPEVRGAMEEALRFVLGMEVPGVGYANFVDRRLRPNLTGETSRAGLGWWAARALRAFAESEELLSGALRRRVGEARERLVDLYGASFQGSVLPGGATDAASVWLLGLAASPGEIRVDLVRRLATGLMAAEGGRGRIPSWLGDGTGKPRFLWHGWGSYQPAALAEASRVLGDPRALEAAKRLLDDWYVRLLLTGIPYLVEGDRVTRFPRIAYAAQTAVESATTMYRLTGEERYRAMAGLFAAWFLGANHARRAVYDPESGRVYDDVRGGDGDGDGTGELNLNSGAESTIEGLMVMQRLRDDPELAAWARLRPVEAELEPPLAIGSHRHFRGGGREVRVTLRGDRGTWWSRAPFEADEDAAAPGRQPPPQASGGQPRK